jgi:glucokinase
VADIGGTNARFGWIGGERSEVGHVLTLAVADFAEPVLAVRAYLSEIAGVLGGAFRAPRWAAIAVATAPQADLVEFTNSPWRFSRSALASDLGLDGLLTLNDFEALALSLPRLRPSQVHSKGRPIPLPGTLAVIGPGTGLGVAAVTPSRVGWVTLPGEGGHASLAPGDDFESALLGLVRSRYAHVSAERLLSGIGLPVLYGAVGQVLGVPVEALGAGEVVARGLERQDAVCDRTLDVFCALLGGFAGNVALTVGARGGVFIGGGIVPRFGERFFTSAFRERFEAKGRLRPYLEAIPTALITDTLAALGGAALAIEQHEA